MRVMIKGPLPVSRIDDFDPTASITLQLRHPEGRASSEDRHWIEDAIKGSTLRLEDNLLRILVDRRIPSCVYTVLDKDVLSSAEGQVMTQVELGRLAVRCAEFLRALVEHGHLRWDRRADMFVATDAIVIEAASWLEHRR